MCKQLKVHALAGGEISSCQQLMQATVVLVVATLFSDIQDYWFHELRYILTSIVCWKRQKLINE